MSFDEYWEHYVRVSSDPAIRRAHFATTSAALGCAALGLVSRRLLVLLLSPAVGAVPLVLARRLLGAGPLPHGPVVFLALAAIRAWRLELLGRMDAEIARLMPPGSYEEPPGSPVPRPNMVTDHTLH